MNIRELKNWAKSVVKWIIIFNKNEKKKKIDKKGKNNFCPWILSLTRELLWKYLIYIVMDNKLSFKIWTKSVSDWLILISIKLIVNKGKINSGPYFWRLTIFKHLEYNIAIDYEFQKWIASFDPDILTLNKINKCE